MQVLNEEYFANNEVTVIQNLILYIQMTFY